MYNIMNVYKHRAQRASVSWSKQPVLWQPAVTTWADLTQAPVHQWRPATNAPPTVTTPWTQSAAMPTWLTVCIILYFPLLSKPEFFARSYRSIFQINSFVVYREPLHPEAALLSVFEIQQSNILGEIRNHARRNLWRFWPNQDRFCEFGTLLPMHSRSSLRHLSFFKLSVLICRLTAVSMCPTWDPWLWRVDLQTPSPALTLIPTPAPTTCVHRTDTPITLSATTASTLLRWAKVWKQATRLVIARIALQHSIQTSRFT